MSDLLSLCIVKSWFSGEAIGSINESHVLWEKAVSGSRSLFLLFCNASAERCDDQSVRAF